VTRYLTEEDIININKQITGNAAVINSGALSNAVEGPKRSYAGNEIYTSLPSKAYAMALAIAQNHPFEDGNKRTATTAINEFLNLNDHHVSLTNQVTLQAIVNRLADEDPIEEDEFIESLDKLTEAKAITVV